MHPFMVIFSVIHLQPRGGSWLSFPRESNHATQRPNAAWNIKEASRWSRPRCTIQCRDRGIWAATNLVPRVLGPFRRISPVRVGPEYVADSERRLVVFDDEDERKASGRMETREKREWGGLRWHQFSGPFKGFLKLLNCPPNFWNPKLTLLLLRLCNLVPAFFFEILQIFPTV